LRIALIADIHSNLQALDVVLTEIQKEGIQVILNAGDVVGYGPRPNEVIDVLGQTDIISIRGNHDNAVLTGRYDWFNPYAAAAAKWTAKSLTGSSLEYLRRLEQQRIERIDGKTIGLFHGSPHDPDEYVMDESRAKELLERSDPDVVVCGHTHCPMEVRAGERVFINPGAVGQPRDRNPAASFCVLDLATLESSTKRIDYDIPSVQKDMLSKGLPRPLAERLSEGR